jgi:hypothetical protein
MQGPADSNEDFELNRGPSGTGSMANLFDKNIR